MSEVPDAHAVWDAARSLGLDPWPVHFESVPATVLYEFAAYLIPGRMSHWSYGKAFHAMKMRYDYGLAKLYEMVINANPAYAFLLETNSPLENVFVMAHVMGHVDFFKHNHCFKPTPPDMVDQAARHAERIRQYEFEKGLARVEALLDAALAIQDQVEVPAYHPPAVRPKREPRPAASYDDLSASERPAPTRVPQHGIPDLMQFLVEKSPELEDWERDILSMVRGEMRYFWPQIRTKIMNEGWATYWHVRLMRELSLTNDQYVDFARLHSSVLQPARLGINPYLLGSRIFEDIGSHEGPDALWLAREVDDDVSFVRNHLTEDLVEDLNLYTWAVQSDRVVVTHADWKAVREKLVADLVHGGIPVIEVDDGDYNRRQELYLIHRHEGHAAHDLDLPYARQTLRHVWRLWGRPVHLETRRGGRRMVLTFDGDRDHEAVL